VKEAQPKQDVIDKAFHLSLLLKGLNGLLEILGGLLLLVVRPEQINDFAHHLTDAVLARDPDSFWANHFMDWANGIGEGSLLFGAIYLLSHGIVKLFVVIEVWRNRSWAYPLLIVVIGLFVVYQLYYLIFQKVTFGMIFLTVFDLVVIYLTVVEYRRHKARHNFAEDLENHSSSTGGV
jgi:uncharacterized membrane protein